MLQPPDDFEALVKLAFFENFKPLDNIYAYGARLGETTGQIFDLRIRGPKMSRISKTVTKLIFEVELDINTANPSNPTEVDRNKGRARQFFIERIPLVRDGVTIGCLELQDDLEVADFRIETLDMTESAITASYEYKT